MSNLEQFIEKLKGKFDLFQSEASVSVQIVIPILQHLGWETSNPQSVVPEYRVQDRRVDYALFSPNITTAPNLIIEVKAIGKVEADLQLFEYAFLTGVVLAILTDGKVWRVYLPLGGGNFQERLVRTIDLESSEARDSASALRKFLARHNVVSGKAQESAQTVINEKSNVYNLNPRLMMLGRILQLATMHQLSN